MAEISQNKTISKQIKRLKLTNNTRDLLIELVRTSFKLKYKNSILGFVWVLLKPFLMFLILYVVWTSFAGSQDFYPVKLMLGIILFTFLNEGIIFGMNGLLDKASIILKVNFNRQIAVLASTIMSVINLCINFLLFQAIFIIYIGTKSPQNPLAGIASHLSTYVSNLGVNIISFLYFGLIVITMYIFMLGASFFLSILIVRVRDMQHVAELFFQLMFWATPIVYPLTQLRNSPTFYHLVSLNPIGRFINAAREALIYNNIEYKGTIFGGFFISIIFAGLGYLYFRKKVKKVAEYF